MTADFALGGFVVITNILRSHAPYIRRVVLLMVCSLLMYVIGLILLPSGPRHGRDLVQRSPPSRAHMCLSTGLPFTLEIYVQLCDIFIRDACRPCKIVHYIALA